MRHWYEEILSEFVIGIKPITIVVDPDHLLAEENLTVKLNDMGFVIESFENSIDFRYLFETKYRPSLSGNSPELLITTLDLSQIPFDILTKARVLEVSLNKIYPNLNWHVVSSLDNQYYNRLYEACQEHLSEKLGENSTKNFILRHVFEIAPELINRTEDLMVVLLKRHYRDINVPEMFDKKLIVSLKRKGTFNNWPLDKIVPDRNAFWAFLQENWKVYLDSMTDNSLNCIVPFDYDDIRVYIDNLFAEGFLEQVETKLADSLKSSWVRVGISYGKKSDDNKFESLLEITKNALPDLESSYHDWISFCIKYSKLASAYYSNETENSNFSSSRQQANEIFEKWLLNKYGGLCNLPASKPVLVHHIPRWMAAQKVSKQALIVIDGLSLSQWITIDSEIKAQLQNYKITESALFAWIPTITSVSRQAIFSGKAPLFFSDSIFITQREEKLWHAFWKNQGIAEREIAYQNGIGSNNENIVDELAINPRTKYVGLIINTVDKIMHGMQLGELGMHDQVKLWARQGMLVNLIEYIVNKGFKIIITSDHGNSEGIGMGTPAEGAVADIRGQRVRIYSDAELCKKTHSEFTETIIWPAFGLPEAIYPLVAKDNKAFVKSGQSTVGHGGISLEETIVPFITIERQS
jgi:hypothetical protein